MQQRKSKVTIVIPNYNGREHLQRLLPSIVNQTYGEYDVIIIDDCSPDRAAVEYVKEFIAARENMQLVENRGNLGFAKTCNKGFKLATADYVCLLTNDTEVKSSFLDRTVEIMDADSSIGVLSCIILDGDGNNWFSRGSFRAGIRVNLRDDFEGVRSVDWVAGTACCYRRELFDEIGLLDEDFVMYHEDIDFCLRVRQETDYRVCVFPEKLVIHYRQPLESQAPNLAREDRKYYYCHRNHILLLKRYCPQYLPKILLHNLREIIDLLVVPILKREPRSFPSSIHAIILIVRGTLAGLMKRQRE